MKLKIAMIILYGIATILILLFAGWQVFFGLFLWTWAHNLEEKSKKIDVEPNSAISQVSEAVGT